MSKLALKTKLLFISLVLGFGLGLGLFEKAKAALFFNPWDNVETYVQQTLSMFGSMFTGQDMYDTKWKMSEVFIRIQSPVGLQVPWLASLMIVPEVEVVFEPPPAPNK